MMSQNFGLSIASMALRKYIRAGKLAMLLISCKGSPSFSYCKPLCKRKTFSHGPLLHPSSPLSPGFPIVYFIASLSP